MLCKELLVDHGRLDFLNERRSELRAISGNACDQARWACAQAAQVQKDIKHMRRSLPLNAQQVESVRQSAAACSERMTLAAEGGHEGIAAWALRLLRKAAA